MKTIKQQILENIDKIPDLYKKIVLVLLDIGSVEKATTIAEKYIVLNWRKPKNTKLQAVLHGELNLTNNENSKHVANDSEKFHRMQSPIAKKLNAEMARLYDESKFLKSRKLTENTPKEERKIAAFRILDIHEKELPPLYKKRYEWIHFGIMPSELKISEPRPEELKDMPSVETCFRLINKYRVQISRNRDNRARKEDVRFWKNELTKLLGYIKYFEKSNTLSKNKKSN